MANTKRLFRAVDNFANAMKERLNEKADQGFKGWDNPKEVTSKNLLDRMHGKLARLRIQDLDKTRLPKKDLVDIANFAMMLHKR